LAGSTLAPFVMVYALWKTPNMWHIEFQASATRPTGPLDVRPL
jgi:hypothetical protein